MAEMPVLSFLAALPPWFTTHFPHGYEEYKYMVASNFAWGSSCPCCPFGPKIGAPGRSGI